MSNSEAALSNVRIRFESVANFVFESKVNFVFESKAVLIFVSEAVLVFVSETDLVFVSLSEVVIRLSGETLAEDNEVMSLACDAFSPLWLVLMTGCFTCWLLLAVGCCCWE